MNGVNETLLARLHKKFESAGGEEQNQFKQMQTALEEIKAQIAKMQMELKADLLAIDKKIEELLKGESLKQPELKPAPEKEMLEERYVISPKTGVIEKVKAKRADYIEAKPAAIKKERTKSKNDIIEAEDSTPLDAKGNLFKRLKESK